MNARRIANRRHANAQMIQIRTGEPSPGKTANREIPDLSAKCDTNGDAPGCLRRRRREEAMQDELENAFLRMRSPHGHAKQRVRRRPVGRGWRATQIDARNAGRVLPAERSKRLGRA